MIWILLGACAWSFTVGFAVARLTHREPKPSSVVSHPTFGIRLTERDPQLRLVRPAPYNWEQEGA